MAHKLIRTIAFLTVLTCLISSCGKSKSEIEAEEAEAAALSDKFFEERAAEREAGRKELVKADKKQLSSLLSVCKNEIVKLANEEKRQSFDVFIVDDYNADVYQAVAHLGGGSIQPDSERVDEYLKAVKNNPGDTSVTLNTDYTVIVTEDSFSGLQKKPINYTCDVGAGLKLNPVRAY